MKMIKDKFYTQKQWGVVEDIKIKKPRHVILEGAVRSGKTYLGILYWYSILNRYKNKLFIMTGHTISSLKRNVLDDISKLFGIDTHLNINNEFEMLGNRVACFGSDKADSFKSMRGLTAQGWYANEVILSHQNSVLEAFARTSEVNARIVWETNPDKPTHYIKTNYIDRSGIKLTDGSYDILSYHFELDDNTFLDLKYVESLKNSIPAGTVYDRQIKGLWRATDKAIYNKIKIINEEPNEARVQDYCYGLDFGYNHPTALVKIMYIDGEIYIKGEFCESHLITSEIVDRVKDFISDKNIPIYCDIAEPDKIRALRDAGFNAKDADKSKGTVLAGINKLKEYTLHLVYDPVLIRQVENYEFRSMANGEILEEPVKIDDDYCDAIRYADYNHNKTHIDNINESIAIMSFDDNYNY